ncbi:MAG TPA: GNAT family protein [Jiangellaceae bacterium]
MNLHAELTIGEFRLRTLTPADASLVVEATRAETAPAFWGPRPVGPYTFDDAVSALRAWDPDTSGQASYGVFEDARLTGALGLMPDGPSSAELAYWLRPEDRGRGIAWRSVEALTAWAYDGVPLTRVWLEIDPVNVASRRVAERAGFAYEQRLVRHCRAWTSDDPDMDSWHDCDIWVHQAGVGGVA